MPDGIIGVDKEGRIRFLNNQIQTLFRYSESELINKPIEILIPERFALAHVHLRDRFSQSPSQRAMGEQMELTGLRSDGTEFPVAIGLNHLGIHKENFVTGGKSETQCRCERT